MSTEEQRLRQVGAMIIRRRLDLGMRTKIRLADETGLSTRILGDIEAGKRRAGSVTYIQIEQALKWPVRTIDGFLDGSGSILDDEVVNATVDAPPATATVTMQPAVVIVSDLPPEEQERVREYADLLRRAGRAGGSDYDRRAASQNSAGEENQDPGGIE